MRKFLIIAGLILSANGLSVFFLSNLNLGTVLTVLSGCLLFLWGIFYEKIKDVTKKGITKYIKYIFIFLLCAEIVLLAFIAVYGMADKVNYNEDAVIVLGAAIRGNRVTLPLGLRLDKAVEYHKKNPSSVIVVTGGQGFQENITEASAMEKYLIDKGVNQNAIIKEERATSTNENMRFSKEILDTYFGGQYKTVIITNHFHIYRSVSIAKFEGIGNANHIHAGLQWYNLAPCYLRESLAVIKMWAFNR